MRLRQMNKTGYYLIYLFMLSFFLGILFVNIRHDVWIKEDGLLNVAMMKQLKSSELDGGYLFGYIVRHRILVILVVSMMASTFIGLPIVCAYVCYLGISAGCILSVAVIRYGIRGVFFMAASVFPHGFLLIPAYFLLFVWSLDCNRRLFGRTDGIEGRYFSGRQFILRKGAAFVGIMLLLMLGCIVESYVNPHIVHLVLKIF